MKSINDVKLKYLINKILGKISEAGGDADHATTADKLKVSRSMKVDLQSSNSASFDGSEDATIGVDGVLPESKGGTGKSNLTSALKQVSPGIVRIETQSYVGGDESSKTLTFTIDPVLVVIRTSAMSLGPYEFIWSPGSDYIYPSYIEDFLTESDSDIPPCTYVTKNEKSITLRAREAENSHELPSIAMNDSGLQYEVIAFGYAQ